MMKRKILVLLLAGFVTTLGACGGDSGTTTAAPPSDGGGDGGGTTAACDIMPAAARANAQEAATSTCLTFDADILPLFTTSGAFVSGGVQCNACHSGLSGAHELDMGTHAGILLGADSAEAPPGVSILGESDHGVGDYNWGESVLRGRMRNNRMPPSITSAASRDGGCIDTVAAWVEGGATEAGFTTVDTAGSGMSPMECFTTADAFVSGGLACNTCHNGLSGAHELDMGTYTGVLLGADSAEAPPGVSILGATEGGATDVDWDKSVLRGRLRNNRMPPDAWNTGDSTNRDTTEINMVAAWVTAGAPETQSFLFAE